MISPFRKRYQKEKNTYNFGAFFDARLIVRGSINLSIAFAWREEKEKYKNLVACNFDMLICNILVQCFNACLKNELVLEPINKRSYSSCERDKMPLYYCHIFSHQVLFRFLFNSCMVKKPFNITFFACESAFFGLFISFLFAGSNFRR